MHVLKTIPAGIAGALGLLVLAAVSGCGRSDPAADASSAQAPSSNAVAALEAASSAEASASDAEASAAQARARVPAAGTVANNAGDNQKTPPPTVNVAEEAQGSSVEAPQQLRNKVLSARRAGTTPSQAPRP